MRAVFISLTKETVMKENCAYVVVSPACRCSIAFIEYCVTCGWQQNVHCSPYIHPLCFQVGMRLFSVCRKRKMYNIRRLPIHKTAINYGNWSQMWYCCEYILCGGKKLYTLVFQNGNTGLPRWWMCVGLLFSIVGTVFY